MITRTRNQGDLFSAILMNWPISHLPRWPNKKNNNIPSQKLSNSHRNIEMTNPTCLPTPVFSARIPLENVLLVRDSPQDLPQTNVVYLDKILPLNSPNREDGPLALLHGLNYQLPAGKQPVTAALLPAYYECHSPRQSPSERNLCFISMKRPKEPWPGPAGPPWSLGIPDLRAPTYSPTTLQSIPV